MSNSRNRIRLTTPAAVETMAAANHVTPTRSSHAASVSLGGVLYFWAA